MKVSVRNSSQTKHVLAKRPTALLARVRNVPLKLQRTVRRISHATARQMSRSRAFDMYRQCLTAASDQRDDLRKIDVSVTCKATDQCRTSAPLTSQCIERRTCRRTGKQSPEACSREVDMSRQSLTRSRTMSIGSSTCEYACRTTRQGCGMLQLKNFTHQGCLSSKHSISL